MKKYLILFLILGSLFSSFAQATVLDDLLEMYERIEYQDHKNASLAALHFGLTVAETATPVVGWCVALSTNPGNRFYHRAVTASRCRDTKRELLRAIKFLKASEKYYYQV